MPPPTFDNSGESGSQHVLSLAASFAAVADSYALLRPGYPAAALDAALADLWPGATVLDLAAGTGQLTGDLLAREFRVLAVEPLEPMMRQLTGAFPQAMALRSRAENIGLADRSVDAIVIGQAFHWFDADEAREEMFRVLRPGGPVAMFWNHDDPRDPFGAGLRRLTFEHVIPGFDAGTLPAAEEHKSPFGKDWRFSRPRRMTFRWTHRMTEDELVGLLGTYSYVSTASAAARRKLFTEVRAMIADRPLDVSGRLPLAQLCEVWHATRTGNR